MSVDETQKRKSIELEVEDAEEASSEPLTKVLKSDSDTSKHNLETETSVPAIPENPAIPPENNEEKQKDEQEESPCDITIEFQDESISTSVTEIPENPPIPPENNDEREESPCNISIKFHDKSIADTYKSRFLDFLKSFIEFQVECKDELSVEICKDETINIDEWVIVDESEPNNVPQVVDSTANVVIETDTDVVIDTNTTIVVDTSKTPSPSKKRKKRSRAKRELFVVDATPSPTTIQPDLRYTTKFTINAEKAVEENAEQCSKQTCFNCGQAHSLKDCPHPKDYSKINAARQKFKQQPKSSRYHLEEDQKYSHLAPGKLSDELKKALGLYKNEAPHYIYLMRKYGYPPGWLEEAKVVHSNLDMFDIHGNHVKATAAKNSGLDPVKIVDFPGFNVPFDKGVKDECHKYGVPPYSSDFSKDAMVNFYDKQFAKEVDNLETCDMDIDQQESATVSQEQQEPTKPRNEEKPNRDSPSLVDLEQQKLQLLEELNDEIKVDASKDVSIVKTSSFGTPILKSQSPYSTLPNPDNFSKDVSPVINFENLPNSTGKYEQMVDVLQKVRSTMKKINT